MPGSLLMCGGPTTWYAADTTWYAADWLPHYGMLQTFAVPGTIMLSLLAGGLYGALRGSLLVAAVSTAGSCCCYCLSNAVGAPLARTLWPDKLASYAAEVARRRRDLLSYIILLRATPVLPNVRAARRRRACFPGLTICLPPCSFPTLGQLPPAPTLG